jgi:hypothetical protein
MLREPLRSALTALPLAANDAAGASPWRRVNWKSEMPSWYKFPDS